MSSAQDRLIAAALLLAESAWLYAIFSLVALGFGLGEGQLGYLAALLIVTSSFFVTRALQHVAMPARYGNAADMLAGIVVLYLILGFQISGGLGIDLLWVAHLGRESEGSTLPFLALLGGVSGVVLWWRGGRLASEDYPVEALGTTFSLGLVVLGIAAVVDVFHPADLNIFWLMFLFFASCLAGLSVGHLMPPSQQATEKQAWTRTIGGVISAVLIVGLFFSLLHKSVLELLSSAATAVLSASQTVIFYVVIMPVGLVAGLIIDLLLRLWDLLIGDPPPREGDGQGQQLEPPEPFDITELGEPGEPSIIVEIIEWTLLVIFVLLLLFVLSRAFRRRSRRRRIRQEAERESVMGDADPALDMARLLYGLLPNRLRSRGRRPLFRLPDDDADLVEVFRIYFGLLMIADDRGFPRQPNETPMEYQKTLERLVPRDLARRATAAFVKACYGHQPTSRDQVDQMRVSLEQLSAETS